MTNRQFENTVQGHTHHHAIFHMKNGDTIEGYMQPNDDEFVYTTDLDGKAGNAVKISDIQTIEFPS